MIYNSNYPGITQSFYLSSVIFSMLQDLDATPESVVTVKALALSPPAKPLGYEGVAFYLPTAQRDNIEMIVSDVGEEANWKMCVNANTDKSQSSAKVKVF